MCYIEDDSKEPLDVPACKRYEKYGTSHVSNVREIEKEDSVIIISEALAVWSLVYSKCKKVLWWMSVDNYIEHEKINGGNRLFEEMCKVVCLHLVQSEYARQYLLARGVPSDKILYVSDYIGEIYGTFQAPPELRQNIALFNPKKGWEEIEPLIEKADWLKWIPLINLTEEQMAAIMSVAKVYVDFGGHPGKDRIPREAAKCGCCVITNRKGSAAFFQDVPIPDFYKIGDSPMEYDKVENLLRDICEHWEEHYRQFAEYREVISLERQKFTEDVKKFVDIMENVIE